MKTFDNHFIQEMKSRLDVELIGVASVATTTSPELRDRASSLLPGAKSVVVVGKEIYAEVVSLLKPSKEAGELERGELLVTHADYLNGRLTRAVHELAQLFREEGYRSLPLSAVGPTDQRYLTSLLSYKHACQLAGLGTIGRHSLLITPEFGPRQRLACLLTDATLEVSLLTEKDYCMNCDACIKECPAHALQVPAPGEIYSMNKFACRTCRQAGLTCGVCMRACNDAIG